MLDLKALTLKYLKEMAAEHLSRGGEVVMGYETLFCDRALQVELA